MISGMQNSICLCKSPVFSCKIYSVWQPPLFHLIMTPQAAEILAAESKRCVADGKNRCQIHALSIRQISELELLKYIEVFYFYFQPAEPALCSGVGFDPFCCSRMLFIIVLTASFEPFLRLETAPFTRTPTSRRINNGIIKDRAVNHKCSYILLTPPNISDLLCQLKEETAKSWMTGYCEM